MRMTSTSSPSSRKKPRFSATPAGRKDIFGLVTETRTFSAAVSRADAVRKAIAIRKVQMCFIYLKSPSTSSGRTEKRKLRKISVRAEPRIGEILHCVQDDRKFFTSYRCLYHSERREESLGRLRSPLSLWQPI